MTKTPLRPALLLLGGMLRELRDDRGMSLRALAKRLGFTAAELSAWELGSRRPPAEAAAFILGYLHAKPADYEQLVKLHRQSDRPSYVEEIGPGAANLQHVYENHAVRVFEWAPHTLPEVLQSAEDVQAVLRRGDVRLDDIDQELFARQVREVDRPPGYRHVALVGEPALAGTSGLPRKEHVTVLAVPAAACATEASHGFSIYETAAGTFTVVLRHEYARVYLGDPRTVERYRATFRRLQRKALDHTLPRPSR
jgi:transcriptional regulator with XRE-family HTH domain